jgi:protein-S-isoprenylcysteine O-methyltransferase Ste14
MPLYDREACRRSSRTDEGIDMIKRGCLMDKQMSVMGIGLKAGAVIGGYLALTVLVSALFFSTFQITDRAYGVLLVIGLIMAAAGFSINLIAASQMLKAHKMDTLATEGLYRAFLHPMYFFQVFVTLPGIALLFNSYLVLTVIPVAAVAVRLFAREENNYLEKRFGEKYRAYRKKVWIAY